MKHIITNQNFIEKFTEFKLKPGQSVQTLCAAMAQRARSEGEFSLTIHIDKDLLKPSYTTVPAMFARSLTVKIKDFPALQSFERDGHIVIRMADQCAPVTFKARALVSLRKKRKFKVLRSSVPLSYRNRPAILASVLSKELGQTVCNHCKGEKIIWYLK